MRSSSYAMALPRRSLPAMAKVRQKLPSDHVPDVGAPRVFRTKDTALPDESWASEALLEDVKGNRNLEIVRPPSAMPFDSK